MSFASLRDMLPRYLRGTTPSRYYSYVIMKTTSRRRGIALTPSRRQRLIFYAEILTKTARRAPRLFYIFLAPRDPSSSIQQVDV